MSRRTTPLLELHRELGAKLTNFGGWEMPLQYRGVVSEHNAVRSSCGLFDVSHLGKLRISGRDAEPALQEALTADVGALDVGRAGYSLVLEDDGGCVDDVFTYRLDDAEWMIVPNAANVAAVASAIAAAGAQPADEWDRWAILALQGPASDDVFERVFPRSDAPGLALHAWQPLDVLGEAGLVARTGYTGERGFELFVPSSSASAAFSRLLEAGAAPVGLGARDTLRLEMGYPLYGHELDRDVDPLEAGLGWALAWNTPFRGREALARKRDEGVTRKLFGIVCGGRGVPRQGHSVLHRGRVVGTLTSGNFSPTLSTGIGLALGDRAGAPEVGEPVVIEGRGRRIEGDIVKPPFVPRGRAASVDQ